MKSTIVAKVPFHFRGELHEPAMVLDLDDWARKNLDELSDLYGMIAEASGMNPHGYEVEVMEVAEMVFESPTGQAVDFYDGENQQFDFEGFKHEWLLAQSFKDLSRISEAYLSEPLIKGSEMHQALHAAFQLGKGN